MSFVPDILSEKRHLGALGERLWRGAALVGGAAVLAALAIAAMTPDGWHRFFFSYLLAFAYALSLGLGALYFVILHHITNSGWSVVVRRIGEALAATIPFLAVLFIPVLFGLSRLYPWTHAAAVASDRVLGGKAAYLNAPFFVARWVVYFLVWTVLARYFVRRSLAQDETGDASLTLQMRSRSAVAMVAFAFTLTFAAFDILMSLDPHWYSTIFGVYYYAGSVVAIYAFLPLAAFLLQRSGLLRRAITVEHFHDLGKLLFGFIVFWAYIGFSQYMLQWYGNMPEETHWFAVRQQHGWGNVGLTLVFGHFVIPFLALLSRTPKRKPPVLAAVAVWMLVMHWVDLFWLVMPSGSPGSSVPAVMDVALSVGLVSLQVGAAAYLMRRRSLVPERDPRLEESLAFENA